MEDAAKKIWKALGPGYSERVYHNAFEVELRQRNVSYETERIIPIYYQNLNVGNIRADLIVNGDTVVELKSVARLNDQFRIQIQNYMKLLDIPKGYLINFPLGTSEVPEIELIVSTRSLPGNS